jgi:8-oxo-dGTP pyrophosphatase MutT (NUDIX family)
MHPLNLFKYCPCCGAEAFEEKDMKAKQCKSCGFVYYFNPSAAVACFIRNSKDELLIVRRAHAPAAGTLDLPGGFTDSFESAEEAICREVKEETGLGIDRFRYLFSMPNIYPYMGFDVHTLDLFFECTSEDLYKARANDDASEIIVLPIKHVRPESFGLASVSRAVSFYIMRYSH